MNIWLDDIDFLGSFNEIEEVKLKLSEWQEKNEGKVLYLFQVKGEQYDFIEEWGNVLPAIIRTNYDVKIYTATANELHLEVVGSTSQYIDRMAAFLPGLAEKFYARPDQSTWNSLSDFIEGLDFINRSLQLTNLSMPNSEQFISMLGDLMEAMEKRDTVTIADLLTYEWGKWLSAIKGYFINH